MLTSSTDNSDALRNARRLPSLVMDPIHAYEIFVLIVM
jgi:hypothetical protein